MQLKKLPVYTARQCFCSSPNNSHSDCIGISQYSNSVCSRLQQSSHALRAQAHAVSKITANVSNLQMKLYLTNIPVLKQRLVTWQQPSEPNNIKQLTLLSSVQWYCILLTRSFMLTWASQCGHSRYSNFIGNTRLQPSNNSITSTSIHLLCLHLSPVSTATARLLICDDVVLNKSSGLY